MTFCVNSSCDQNHPPKLIFIKVHGHSGNPLFEGADRFAVQGADKQSDNEGTLYSGGRGQEMVFNWVDDADESKSHSWWTHQGARREDVMAN